MSLASMQCCIQLFLAGAGVSATLDQLQDNTVVATGDHRAESGKPATPKAEDSQRWRQRLETILSSRSLEWRRAQLREYCKNLAHHRSRIEYRSDVALASILEWALWAAKEPTTAKAVCRERMTLLKTQVPNSSLFDGAYADAGRYAKLGLVDAACDLYSLAAEHALDSSMAALAEYNVGIILRRNGRFQDAEAHFLQLAKKYRKSQPDRARQCHFLAGDCAWRASKADRAVVIFREVADAYPGTPEADDARHMVRDVIAGETPDDAATARAKTKRTNKAKP